MQYVACKFRSTDTRTYTYFNDGPPVAVGDEVKVADNRDGGCKRVEVVEITDKEPPFSTKPILGLAPPPDHDAEILAKIHGDDGPPAAAS